MNRFIALLALASLAAVAQDEEEEHEHQMHMEHAGHDMTSIGPEGARMPHAREGSGTSWLPDAAPIRAHHRMAGDWMLMLHYGASVGYDDQWSDRGSRRFVSTNWVMGMASHPLLGGEITFRSMLSGEPATAGGSLQIPLLLQSGETYGGQPLHDRQHPHDLFMEVGAIYRHAIVDGVGLELYAAPSGEPALGPTAFMHRPSAMRNPFPPISHHWQDSTHISFPVLTAGVYGSWLKLEGSLFHGREPDENRWDFDVGSLDSWSLRASANPIAQVSLQVSYGFLQSPEALHPEQSEHRLTASAMWSSPIFSEGNVSVTCAWGRNIAPDATSDSLLAEAQVDLDGANVPFARLEWVQKLGEDLVLPGDPRAQFGVAALVVGYARRLPQLGPVVPSIGAALNVGHVPDELRSTYGTQLPVGAFIFLGLEPPKMKAEHHHQMGDM